MLLGTRHPGPNGYGGRPAGAVVEDHRPVSGRARSPGAAWVTTFSPGESLPAADTGVAAGYAITATAYKLARIIYAMLKHGQEYAREGMQEYEAAHRERQLRNLKKKAAELGYELKEMEAAIQG